MRVVAGRFKGRVLQGPTGPGLRPTSDGLRETIFNVLADRVVAARFLDAFAGTGAVGLEALSRGASHATFVERDRRAVSLLEQNVLLCGATSDSNIVRDDFVGVSGRHRRLGQFEIVFLDPPYDFDNLLAVLDEAAALAAPGGLVVLEHSRRRSVPEATADLRRGRVLKAGDSALAFYVPGPPADTMSTGPD
jgi:16S rRNA (guanine(966)-N(2))-methyltransferase RsmD